MVFQELISPSVYLDHWAFREITDSKTLTKRFSEALLFRGGTLVLSWLNIVEFYKVTIDTRVNQMRKRFTTAGVCIPMAKVFSKKNDGLESFFKELEG